MYCVTVAFTITERTDQRICSNAPAHPTSTVLLQDFLAEQCNTQVCQHPYSQIWLPATFGFLQAKIAVESEEIC